MHRGFASTRIVLSATAVKHNSKLFRDADAAVADVKSGSTILSSGFGLCGVAGTPCPERTENGVQGNR